MSRDLPAELEASIDEPVVRPFLAVRIELPDPVYVWTGQGTISFEDSDSEEREWVGGAGLGSLDAIGEGTDGSATGMRVTLLNVPAEFRDDIADQAERGALFEIYVGSLNETFQLIEATQLLWRGKVDTYVITDAGTSISVEVTGENRMRDQNRPSIRRFSHEYQTRKYPGDLAFAYTSRLTEVSILWAQSEQSSSVSSGGIGGLYGALGGYYGRMPV